MIDVRIKQFAVRNDEDPMYYGADNTGKMFIAYGAEESLRQLSDYLQDYIEGLVNQVENQTEQ
jgi:hypothetical protein